jgi:arginase
MPRACAIIQAPSGLGLKPSGVELLPGALLELGLAEDLRATRSLPMELPAHRAEQDPDTGVLNASAIAEWTPHLADAIESVLDRGEFPLILGGDCSILLGSALALRRRGRYGALFIDGHTDFYQPEAEPNGEAASMELAFATGRGPPLLTNLEGRAPLLQDEDVVAFGFRDADEQAAYGARPLPPTLLALDLPAVRESGIEVAARVAIEHLTRDELDGFFIHLDVDVLDDGVMPAVDYRLPGGLTGDELSTLLTLALASPAAIGLEVTIYNPTLDHDGAAGRVLTKILVDAFNQS